MQQNIFSIVLTKNDTFLLQLFYILFWQDRAEGGTSSHMVETHPPLPPSIDVSVSGFKGGTSRTSAEALLLCAVVEVRQNQNTALCFGFGGRCGGR